jgi:hypothetical protein
MEILGEREQPSLLITQCVDKAEPWQSEGRGADKRQDIPCGQYYTTISDDRQRGHHHRTAR